MQRWLPCEMVASSQACASVSEFQAQVRVAQRLSPGRTILNLGKKHSDCNLSSGRREYSEINSVFNPSRCEVTNECVMRTF